MNLFRGKVSVWFLFLPMIGGFLLDMGTKYWADRLLVQKEFVGSQGNSEIFQYPRVIELIPGVVRLQKTMNSGALWGLFQNQNPVLTLINVLAIPFILFLYWTYRERTILTAISLGLVLGGALGNLYDRLALGAVRDFIYVYIIHWPIFNVGDSLITIGSLLLVIDILWFSRKGTTSSASVSASSKPVSDVQTVQD